MAPIIALGVTLWLDTPRRVEPQRHPGRRQALIAPADAGPMPTNKTRPNLTFASVVPPRHAERPACARGEGRPSRPGPAPISRSSA
jgi:hypothetical protein